MADIAKTRRLLLLGMFLIASGSLAIHFTIHSPLEARDTGRLVFTNTVATVFPLLDVVLVTSLFARKETAAWGYMLNGLLVIYGTVFMTHCGWAKVHSPDTPVWRYLLTPTSPDVLIAWADFFMGAVLYKLWFLPAPSSGKPAEGTGS